MEICYEQCYVNNGVVKGTKSRHFPFLLQPYFSALKVSFFIIDQGACSSIPVPMFVKFERDL